MHTPLDEQAGAAWDPKYEFKAVLLLSLGFGLVGLDRNIINPLFPVMAKELGLNYQDLGLVSAVLALTWGIASIFTGRLADRIGRKKVLVPAVIAFSILVAGSGLAGGLISLLLMRGLMGLAEGAFVPASIVSTIEASKPSRIGLNIGIQQMAAPLFGLALGPIIAISLLKVLPSWKWVFGLVAIPGFVVAIVMIRFLRDDSPALVVAGPSSAPTTKWWEVLRYRAVVFNTLGICCYLTCLIVLAAFMPNYLVDHLKLGLDQMGVVLSGLGAGSLVGLVLLPALSDRLGCRPVLLSALVIELVALWMLQGAGAEPVKLFAILFVCTLMNAGVLAITMGPLTSAAVPRGLVASATGMVIGLGEVVGGAIAPAVAGGMAQSMGIVVIPRIALGAIAVGLVLAAVAALEPKRLVAATSA